MGISQPCERPLVTSHVPSCSLFSPSFFLLSLSFSLACLHFCHSIQLLVFSLAFLFLLNPSEHLSIATFRQKSDSCFSFFFFCCQSESCNSEESVIGEKFPFDGIQTVGQDKNDVLLVMQRTTWTDDNKSSR